MPTQEWVQKCLDNPGPLKASWDTIKKERDQLYNKLCSVSCVEKAIPSQTNFIMVILKDYEKTFARLLNSGIYVASCRSAVPNAIRISVSTIEHNHALLEALNQC